MAIPRAAGTVMACLCLFGASSRYPPGRVSMTSAPTTLRRRSSGSGHRRRRQPPTR
jgi:hypothetical protein